MSHKVTNSLLNYLNNGDEVDRCYAAKTLGNLKSKEATQALLERTRDEDIDVCIDAITALGKIREPSAIPMLLESLEKDPDDDVKLAVTESLAQLLKDEKQSQEALDILLKLAEDRPEEMEFDQNSDWDSWWDLQEKAIDILGELKIQKAFPILKTVLEDDFSQDIDAVVLKAMAKIGGEADDYLINRLTNPKDTPDKEKVQRRTAIALGFSQSKETLQALGRALVSKSADTREYVLYALGKRKASQYIRAILLSLRDPHNNVKRAALEVIQDLASDSEIHQELDFNQIAELLSEQDVSLQTAVLSFFLGQNKVTLVSKSLVSNSLVASKLTEENQELIRQCLNSGDDNVITYTAQLVGAMNDTQSIDSLLALALSDSQSEWVRKEVIIALGHLLNSMDNNDAQESALSSLKKLIHHKNQTVRFAAIQAMLILSNESEAKEESDLPPIAIVLATLKGEQFDLEDENKDETEACANDDLAETTNPGTDNCSSCAKSAVCADSVSGNSSDENSSDEKSTDEGKVVESIIKQFEANDISDSDHLIESMEDQPIGNAMSTLEAIAQDNIESALAAVPETEAQKSHDMESGPFISEDLPEEMDEFVEIMRQNFNKGKKLTRRKVDTYSDARQISARLLAENTQSQYDEMVVNALAECLNDDDEQLRLEAAEALSRISLKNPLIPGLTNSFGKLVTLLDSKDRDMRLACIHAISHSGNPAALPHLLDYLADEDYLVKLHAILGLVYVVSNKANLTQEQLKSFMVLDEVSHETVIAALFDCLNDQNYSISMAAIEALTELQQKEAIEQFIDVALTDEGQSARRISRLLKKLDTERSTELLLERLDTVSDSSYRRHVMEMLEVVVTPEADQMEAA